MQKDTRDLQTRKWAALTAANTLLTKLQQPFWLTDGALLGYLREGDLLAHDRDLDIGMKILDYDPLVRHAFTAAGWKFQRNHGTLACGFQEAYRIYEVKLDIFYFYETPTTWWHAAWDGPNMIRYDYQPFALKQVQFRDIIIPIPADTETYVVTKYGPNWRTPITNWDWRYQPANATRTGVVHGH